MIVKNIIKLKKSLNKIIKKILIKLIKIFINKSILFFSYTANIILKEAETNLIQKKGVNIIAYKPASFQVFPNTIGNKGFIKININKKVGKEIINNFFNVLLNVFIALPVF